MDSAALRDDLHTALQDAMHIALRIAKQDSRLDAQKDALHIAVQAVRLYAESHPRPPSLSMKQAAEMLGKSPPTIKKMIDSGLLKLNKLGQIPIAQIDAMYRINGE